MNISMLVSLPCVRSPAVALALILSGPALADNTSGSVVRPNILLIVADDLGYADLGVFGSDIRTPNIDRLAREGVRFSQFHASPMCAPTRAMLLSGNNNHIAGMARQHPVPDLLADVAGYEGHLSERIAPLPAVLQAAGYRTVMAGKWHLGLEAEQSPRAKGFERSFALLDGGGSHWNASGYGRGPSTYRENGEITEWPEGRYSTEVYTDRLIEFIDEAAEDRKPFFAYAAYTSPHWPLQVPEDELDRYAGAYDAGYDALRERNFRNLQAAGIIPADAELPPRNPAIRPWAELSAEERKSEAREMELYAAMVENLDDHIGRLVGHLRRTGQYENTLIVFMGDNGAAWEDFYNFGPFVAALRQQFDNSYENMGRPDSFVSYGPAWAEAGSAPFRLYKGFTTQGGLVAPMIVAGPGVAREDVISDAYVTVMDVAPTLIDAAGASYPSDGTVEPMRGASMLPLLAGDAAAVHADDYVTALFHWGNAYLRQGRWKLTSNERPFDERSFGLYDVEADPGETTDLSAAHPDKRAELLGLWRAQRLALGIVLPEDL